MRDIRQSLDLLQLKISAVGTWYLYIHVKEFATPLLYIFANLNPAGTTVRVRYLLRYGKCAHRMSSLSSATHSKIQKFHLLMVHHVLYQHLIM